MGRRRRCSRRTPLLFESIRAAIGERNPCRPRPLRRGIVDLLLTGRCGVLLVDLAAVSTQPATLVEQIVGAIPRRRRRRGGASRGTSAARTQSREGFLRHEAGFEERAGMFLKRSQRDAHDDDGTSGNCSTICSTSVAGWVEDRGRDRPAARRSDPVKAASPPIPRRSGRAEQGYARLSRRESTSKQQRVRREHDDVDHGPLDRGPPSRAHACGAGLFRGSA